MSQPSVSGHGAGEEPGHDARLPGGTPGGASRSSGGQRDPRLAAFARHGAGDACPPGAGLGQLLDELSGPGRRCAGASDDELTGLLGRWAALEAWAAAAKLAGTSGKRPAGGFTPKVPSATPV